MQAVQKIEILDIQPNVLSQPIKAADVDSTVVNTNGGSKKAAFRKFAAENVIQYEIQFEQSLTVRFNSGSLQEQIRVKKIDPHTLIHKAILENNPEVIRFLLAHEVDVDYPDSYGMTPLTLALLNRCNYAVDVLLEHGANVNPNIKWNDMTLLEISLAMKDHKSALLLLNHGVDINVKGNGALAQAIRLTNDSNTSSEWKKVVEFLIDRGADIHSCQSSSSPLYESIFLAQQGDFFVLTLLLQKGADIHMKVDESIPLLFLAYKWGSGPAEGVPLIPFLIENGADVNQEHAAFGTPLHAAIYDNRFDLIKLFVEKGADLNKKSTIGLVGGEILSPLTLALKFHLANIVQYLLQHGAKA